MTRAFLTGATGFLGSHIAAALVDAGHEVTCSVRATSDTRWIDGLDVDTIELDLRGSGVESAEGSGIEPAGARRGTADEPLAGMDLVIHCGALTRARNEAEFRAVNVAGTERLAGAAARSGVRRFLFISSLAARGPDGAGGPVSPYGRSKRDAEAALAERAGPMQVVILRPGGIYGPRDSDLLPLFAMARRGWVVVPRSAAPLQPVHVSDVVSATLAALEAPPPDAPLPIAGAGLHDWDELAKALARAVDRRCRVVRLPSAAFWAAGLLSEIGARLTGKAPAMDRRRARDLSHHAWTCDIGPSREALGWQPVVGMEEGLARTAAWYRREGWLS